MRSFSIMASIAVLGALTVSGCKSATPGTSDVRTLDNFARKKTDAVKQNVCDGSAGSGLTEQHEEHFIEWFEGSTDPTKDSLIQVQGDGGDAAKTQALQESLKRALTSVPLNLQTIFFGLKNRIVINEFSNEICKGELPELQPHARIFASEGTLDPADFDSTSSARITDENVSINSCWIFNTAKQRVEIHINNDVTAEGRATAVEHSTVRIFAYVLSQIAAHIDLDGASTSDVFGAIDGTSYMPDQYGLTFSKNQDFVQAMMQLEQDIMTDVDGSEGKYDLGFYRAMTANSQTSDSFKHYLFADSFDSFYCSTATRETMVRDFSKSFSTFEQIAGALENMQYDGGVQTGALSEAGPMYAMAGGAVVHSRQFARLFRWVGGMFRGMFRVAYGVARFTYGVVQQVVHTAVRIVRGAIYIAGEIVKGAAVLVGRAVSAAGQVAAGVVRLGAHLLRGVGYLTLDSIRFVKHVLIGGDYYSVLPEQF